MHSTRVIGDKQAALAKVSGVRDKIRPAGKIFNSARRKSSGDFGGDGRVARGAEQHELLLGQTGDQGTPMKNRPAFFGVVFRSRNQTDSSPRMFSPSNNGRPVGLSFEAEMAEHVFPKSGLVMTGLIEVCGRPISVRQKGAATTAAHESKALRTTRQPCFQVAAKRIGEEQDDVRVSTAETPEMQEIAKTAFG